ncbi:MAG: hypothetical protein JO232_02575 [Verrucomicrobia bacterium]|nr:hypothetical protein [Verrucomicrobiota bacterium]
MDLRRGLDEVFTAEALDAFEQAIKATKPVRHYEDSAVRVVEYPVAAICPYRGLQIFREEDAAFFAGRKALVRSRQEAGEREIPAKGRNRGVVHAVRTGDAIPRMLLCRNFGLRWVKAYKDWRVPTAKGSTVFSPNALTNAWTARQPVQCPGTITLKLNFFNSAIVASMRSSFGYTK